MKKLLIATGVAVLAIATVAAAQSYSFQTNLTVGSTGADVTALQTWLIGAGYQIPAISSGAASKGYFGSQTKAAVQQFQAAKGVPSTGFVGPLTRGVLNGGSSVAMAPASSACPAGYTCTANPGTTVAANGTTVAGAPAGITTPGVSGTLTVANSGSVANGATVNDGQTVNVAGFKFQSGPSDMQVTTITADFNVRPWLYFSSFSLVNQTTGKVLIPPTPVNQASFVELTASQDYRYTLGGLNFVVPHGQTVNVVLSATLLSGTGKSAGNIDIIAFSLRSVDGTGVVDTESLPLLTLPYTGVSPYGGVYYSGSLTANLVASIDPTSPQTQIIQTQSGSVTNNVPLVTYDVQAQNNQATLQGLTLNIGVNGTFGSPSVTATPSNVFSTITLQAAGMTYYGTITSGTTNGTYTPGTVTFNNNVLIPLTLGQNVQLKIVANVAQGVTGVTASTSLATATAGVLTGVDANYNTPGIQNVGTIASAVTTFSTTAAFSVVAGPAPTAWVSYTPTTQNQIAGNVNVTWPFTFTVSAGTSPIYISANPGSAVAITSDLVSAGNTVGPLGVGTASSTQPVSITSATSVTGDTNTGLGTGATGSFYVPSNSSRTFTVQVKDDNTTNASTDSNAIVALTGVYYSSTATAAGTKVGTTTAGTGFTGTQSLYTLPNQVQGPSTSLLKS